MQRRAVHAPRRAGPARPRRSSRAPAPLIPALSDVHDLAIDTTGFYTGNEGHGTGVFDGRLAIDWGTWATRWKDDCLGATQSLASTRACSTAARTRTTAAPRDEFPDGSGTTCSPSRRATGAAALVPDTNDGLGEALGPRDMVVAPTARPATRCGSSGEFTTVNGAPQPGITRFVPGHRHGRPTAATTAVSSPRSGEARVAFRPAFDTDDGR